MNPNQFEIDRVIIEGIREIHGLTLQDAYGIVSQLQAARRREIKEALLRDYSPEWMQPESFIGINAIYPERDPKHQIPLKEVEFSMGTVYRLTRFRDGTPVAIGILQGTPRDRALALLKRITSMVSNMPDEKWADLSTKLPDLRLAKDDLDEIPF